MAGEPGISAVGSPQDRVRAIDIEIAAIAARQHGVITAFTVVSTRWATGG